MYRKARIYKMYFLSPQTTIVLLSVFEIVHVLGTTPDTYFECEKYPGDQWDQIDKTNRECIRDNIDGGDTIFCQHWECAKLDCPEEEQITWPDGCKACPGWCSVGGKIRALGASFTCVDNINTCTCVVGGGMMTTSVYPNSVMFCNAEMEQ